MKKIIMISILIFSFISFADSDIALCEKEGMRFGDGNGKDEIPSDCFDKFFKKASHKLKIKSRDGKITVHGYKNIIFIKDPDSKTKSFNVIAGKYTELEDIEMLFFDEINKEIVVLEKNGTVLFFSSVITGNVSPLRTLKHQDLEGTSDLVVHEKDLIVLKPQNKEIIYFSRLANIHLPEEKRRTRPSFILRGISGEKLKLDPGKNILEVTGQNSFFSIDLVSKKVLSQGDR